MVTFNQLWQLFAARGATANQYPAAEQLWQTFSPDVQQRIYDSIIAKLSQGGFLLYNPSAAIEEHARKVRRAGPVNYFGRPLSRSITYYTATYKGQRGLYTAQDVQAFHMSDPEIFEI